MNRKHETTHHPFRKTQNQKVSSFINFLIPIFLDDHDPISRSPADNSNQEPDEPIGSTNRSPEPSPLRQQTVPSYIQHIHSFPSLSLEIHWTCRLALCPSPTSRALDNPILWILTGAIPRGEAVRGVSAHYVKWAGANFLPFFT